jgi:hypothetical protein
MRESPDACLRQPVMIEKHFLDDTLLQLRKLKVQAERAFAQVDDQAFFRVLGADENSIALIIKHMAGNMRSRWTDFLTSDGEKPDRNRDTEFELDQGNTREQILRLWDDGWSRVFAAIEPLGPDDLMKTVTIRGEPHTVLEAIQRQATHYAAHVGQIVLLSKHYAGANWNTLSIPKGKSKDFDVAKSGAPYNVKS